MSVSRRVSVGIDVVLALFTLLVVWVDQSIENVVHVCAQISQKCWLFDWPASVVNTHIIAQFIILE